MFELASPRSEADRTKVLDLVDASSGLVATKQLLDAGATLEDAKATVEHLSRRGRCHRCKQPVASMGLLSECPKCHSLNINW